MQKMDPKKFPKRPEQIWDKSAPDQAPDIMRQMAIGMASNGTEFFKKQNGQ